MVNKSEQLQSALNAVTARGCIFAFFGIIFTASGILGTAVDLLSPRPETAFDWIINGGMLALGIINLSQAISYVRLVGSVRNLQAQTRRLRKKEEKLSTVLGPNFSLWHRKDD